TTAPSLPGQQGHPGAAGEREDDRPGDRDRSGLAGGAVGLAEEREEASLRLEELTGELSIRLQLPPPEPVRRARARRGVARAAGGRVEEARADVVPEDPVPLLHDDGGGMEDEVILRQGEEESRRGHR